MHLTETYRNHGGFLGDESTYDWNRMGVWKIWMGGEPESSLSSGVQELTPDWVERCVFFKLRDWAMAIYVITSNKKTMPDDRQQTIRRAKLSSQCMQGRKISWILPQMCLELQSYLHIVKMNQDEVMKKLWRPS